MLIVLMIYLAIGFVIAVVVAIAETRAKMPAEFGVVSHVIRAVLWPLFIVVTVFGVYQDRKQRRMK